MLSITVHVTKTHHEPNTLVDCRQERNWRIWTTENFKKGGVIVSQGRVLALRFIATSGRGGF